MFDFDLFRKEVLDNYEDKKQKGLLNNKLENPTPANLRDYILQMPFYQMKKEDLLVIEDYFLNQENDIDLEKRIKKVDLGKIKSIQNFIQGITKTPDESIVKLLAVLIDFQPRPFHKWRACQIEQKNDVAIFSNQEESLSPLNQISQQPTFVKEKNKSNKKLVGITVAGISLFCSGILINQQTKEQECMYWNGTQYVQVACSNKNISHPIIAFDEKNLINFKKITQTDTLKESDASHIWYSKIKGNVEFFTAPGSHPKNSSVRLKPATEYRIRKYAKTISSKD